MTSLKAKFQPGQRVIIADDIPGIVERVGFYRGMDRPLYQVEWWDCSDAKLRDVHEEDLRAAE